MSLEDIEPKTLNHFKQSMPNEKDHIIEAQLLYYSKKRQLTFNKLKEFFEEHQ